MLERSVFHTDKEESHKAHKSGWQIWTFKAMTTVPGYERMEFSACDLEHAERQAKRFVKKHGGEVLKIGRF